MRCETNDPFSGAEKGVAQLLENFAETYFAFREPIMAPMAGPNLSLPSFDEMQDSKMKFLELGLAIRACPANVARVRKSVKWEDGTRLSDRPE